MTGYAGSDHRSSPENLESAAEAAFGDLRKLRSDDAIFLFSFSLGSYATLHLASHMTQSEVPLAGLAIALTIRLTGCRDFHGSALLVNRENMLEFGLQVWNAKICEICEYIK